jgi:alpha-1,6-mannosyltransferase
VLKAASALAVLATALLVARVAPVRGVDPLRAAAFVALNPLVLVHVVGGPHNDAFAVLLMTAGVAALLSARELSAGASLVAATAVKASAAVILPFALAAAARPPGPMGRFVTHPSTNRPIGGFVVGGGWGGGGDRGGGLGGVRVGLGPRFRSGGRESGAD